MQTFNSFTDLAAANGTKAYTGSFGSSNNADLDTVWDNSAILSPKVAAEYEEYKCLHESLQGAHSDDPHLRTKFPTVYEWQNMDEDWRASYLNDIRLNASLWKAMQESPDDFRNANSADRNPSVFNEDTVTPEYEEYKQLIADANQMYVKRDMPPSPNFAPVPFENWQSMSPELRQEYMNDVRDGMKWMEEHSGTQLVRNVENADGKRESVADFYKRKEAKQGEYFDARETWYMLQDKLYSQKDENWERRFGMSAADLDKPKEEAALKECGDKMVALRDEVAQMEKEESVLFDEAWRSPYAGVAYAGAMSNV